MMNDYEALLCSDVLLSGVLVMFSGKTAPTELLLWFSL